MLALLKPWRCCGDLIEHNVDWPTAFEKFLSTTTAKERQVLGGIDYYYDLKTACERNDGSDNVSGVAEQNSQRSTGCVNTFDETGEELEETSIVLTEADLQTFKHEQTSPRERAHALAAIAIGTSCGLFPIVSHEATIRTQCLRSATALDLNQLASWQTTMQHMIAQTTSKHHGTLTTSATEHESGEVSQLQLADSGEANLLAVFAPDTSVLTPEKAEDLLEDQRRAYNIVDWHLQKMLSGLNPPQLHMIIPGEGGVGKSKTIQTITDNFVSHGAGSMLVKSAYTGIAASVIDGKTLHVIGMIPINGGKQSAVTMKVLEEYWIDKHYLIIDEISMVSREFFAKLSNVIGRARANRAMHTDDPFGGLNVILVGDFHQFPPVANKASAPLYWPSKPEQGQ